MMFFERDIAIDLGTVSTRIFIQGKGIRLRESTVVAVDRISGRLIQMGEEAKKMLGRTPANIVPIYPISSGVISDFDMTSRMLKEFISRITSFSLFKPRILILVPGSITGVEERAIIDAVIEAGARKVYLMVSSVATALGAGIDVSKPDGHLVIDIGGGTTEIAVVTLGGVAASRSIKTAGLSMDEAIVKYVRKKYGVEIGKHTAENLKKNIGCVSERLETLFQEVKGRDINTGLPKTINISSTDICIAVKDSVNRILDAVHNVLEDTAPELVADVSSNGIILSGGGSLIYGMDSLIYERTGISTVVVDDALSCNAYGGGRALFDLDSMQDGLINLARHRQMKNYY